MYYVIEDIEGIQVLEFDENWPILDVESVLSGPWTEAVIAELSKFLFTH